MLGLTLRIRDRPGGLAVLERCRPRRRLAHSEKPPVSAAPSRAERIVGELRPGAAYRAESELIDDSHLHAGHAGACEAKDISACASSLPISTGLRTLQGTSWSYRSLGELMQTDIHALSITALTPDEAR